MNADSFKQSKGLSNFQTEQRGDGVAIYGKGKDCGARRGAHFLDVLS